MANLLKGVAVSGEYVKSLKDRHFTILKAPRYENSADLDNPEAQKEKLVIFVRLTDGAELDYYANKTSQKAMANMWGYDMDKWINKVGEWDEPTKQKVRGEDREVLYVMEIKTNGKKK